MLKNPLVPLAAVVAIGVAGVMGWLYLTINTPVDGPDCSETTAEAATAAGLSYNHTMSSMRDPSNGVLVVNAVGQPYTKCRMLFSNFRCEAPGPATVRARAGADVRYFDVPAGQVGIVRGNGTEAHSCILVPAGS